MTKLRQMLFLHLKFLPYVARTSSSHLFRQAFAALYYPVIHPLDTY